MSLVLYGWVGMEYLFLVSTVEIAFRLERKHLKVYFYAFLFELNLNVYLRKSSFVLHFK